MILPAALAGGKLGWARPSAATAPAPRLSLAFRSGVGEHRHGAAYQQELRATIAKLETLGYRVKAQEMGTDTAKGRLSGTCRLPVSFFPVSCGSILADWLRGHPSRYVCAFLDESPNVVACSPAEVAAIVAKFA